MKNPPKNWDVRNENLGTSSESAIWLVEKEQTELHRIAVNYIHITSTLLISQLKIVYCSPT